MIRVPHIRFHSPPPLKARRNKGFSLIELSIVLVIIGLIVGGVLVGKDLVRAAAERAQVTQIEKFNQAANTFFGKYGYLPGDIPDPAASSFGLMARGPYAGEGDGNGVIQGTNTGPSNSNGAVESAGETLMFWEDLSAAHLIEGTFTLGMPNTSLAANTSPIGYFPSAKIGSGNYVYAWSGTNGTFSNSLSTNYYAISNVSGITGQPVSTPGLTVLAASHIDAKIDDGLPQSGRVLAFYLSGVNTPTWASNSTNNGGVPFNTAITGSATTCFDNGGVAGVQQYSVQTSGGSNVNCALSFRMQAGD